MKQILNFKMLEQPTETTCGPACLHAIYNYFKDHISLDQLVREVRSFEEGGTLAVFLGCHALSRGYTATIYTYNLNVFDPTWFTDKDTVLQDRLKAQASAKDIPKIHTATEGYVEFLDRGGRILFQDLTTSLIRRYLKRFIPIITGLSSTYLYRSQREFGPKADFDDIRGEPSGHFVVLSGYNREERTVTVADPFLANPYSESHHYRISIDRVVCSILLGVLTHDANLLIIEPRKGKHANVHNHRS